MQLYVEVVYPSIEFYNSALLAPDTPSFFQLKKEIRRGKSQKKGKGGGWWGAACASAR